VTSGEFRERLLERTDRAGVAVDPAVLAALETYFSLLARWNLKVNLTALPLDPPRDETFDRLLVEPLEAADHIKPVPASESGVPAWFDLGSGGGSPAIPLKIVRPSWALTMVEARERKASFLREAVRTLGLEETHVANARIEDLDAYSGRVDLLTVRAVKIDAELSGAMTSLLTPSGLVASFGSAEAVLPGFSNATVQLNPASVLTLLRRVPRGT
jgi:16S rRNA (guanine527-N7)-methyltransferase